MKILRKNFSYGLTSSFNYNSVRIDRSIEVEFSEDDFLKEQEHYQAICDELKTAVHKELEHELIERSTIERERRVESGERKVESGKADASIPANRVVSKNNVFD